MRETPDTNLLEETLSDLNDNGKSPQDVRWVGNGDAWATWETFAAFASRIHYYSGYGTDEIPSDLVVVGDDWWLERCDYDGAEWWEFKTLPTKPQTLIDQFPVGIGLLTEGKEN